MWIMPIQLALHYKPDLDLLEAMPAALEAFMNRKDMPQDLRFGGTITSNSVAWPHLYAWTTISFLPLNIGYSCNLFFLGTLLLVLWTLLPLLYCILSTSSGDLSL